MSEQRYRGPKKNKLIRQESALLRKEERASISDQAQLDKLDAMFGKDKGAKKERARLNNLIASNQEMNSFVDKDKK